MWMFEVGLALWDGARGKRDRGKALGLGMVCETLEARKQSGVVECFKFLESKKQDRLSRADASKIGFDQLHAIRCSIQLCFLSTCLLDPMQRSIPS